MSSPEARSLWRALSAADAAGIRRQIVPDPGERRAHRRAVRRVHPVDLARTDASAGHVAAAVGVRPAGPGAGDARGRRAALPRHGAEDLEAPARNADFTGRARRLSCCATSCPGAVPSWSPRPCTGLAAWARPSSRRSTRTGSWPTTTWSGGCRPSGRRRSACRSPSWPARWSCGSATTSPRRPRRRWRSCARTPSPLAAHLRQRRQPEAARVVAAGRGRARHHHLAEPGVDEHRRPARGGCVLPGGKHRPPAAPCAPPGPGGRQPGRRGPRRPAARDRAGERVA